MMNTSLISALNENDRISFSEGRTKEEAQDIANDLNAQEIENDGDFSYSVSFDQFYNVWTIDCYDGEGCLAGSL